MEPISDRDGVRLVYCLRLIRQRIVDWNQLADCLRLIRYAQVHLKHAKLNG